MTPAKERVAKARKTLKEAGGKRIDLQLSPLGVRVLGKLQAETNENVSRTIEMALRSALERCREKPPSWPALEEQQP